METASPDSSVTPRNEYETIIDGVFEEMQFVIPASDEGVKPTIQTERIKIRKISIQKMDELSRAWGKPAREVAVYLNIDPARVDQLTEKSFETAMQEGRRLNFPSFAKWWKWQAQTLEAFGQGSQLNALIENVTGSLAQQILSGKSLNS